MSAVSVFVLLSGVVAAQEKPARVYLGWDQVIAGQKLEAGKPVEGVTVLGLMRGRQTFFSFAPAGKSAKRMGILRTQAASDELKAAIIKDLDGADGMMPVLATGNLSILRDAAPPPAGGHIMTHVYRGPFHEFKVSSVKVLSDADARAMALKLAEDKTTVGYFLRQVTVLSFGKVDIRVTLVSAHPQNPVQKGLTSGVVVGVTAVNKSGEPFTLPPPDVVLKVGDKVLTGTPRKLRGGYLTGAAVFPAKVGRRMYRWSFKLSEELKGGEDADLTLTFKTADGTVQTYAETLKVVEYGKRKPIQGQLRPLPAPVLPRGPGGMRFSN
jgi:hypothetical protein